MTSGGLRLLVLSILLLGVEALAQAQQYCPTSTPCPAGGCCGGGAGIGGGFGPGGDGLGGGNSSGAGGFLTGDPVALGDGYSFFESLDVEVQGTLSSLRFNRVYSMLDQFLAGNGLNCSGVTNYIPRPFGADPVTSCALNWYHNYYSFVSYVGGMTFGVYRTDGRYVFFGNCPNFPTSSCMMNTYYGAYDYIDDKLYWDAVKSRFVYYRSDNTRFIYATNAGTYAYYSGGTYYYLTSIEGPDYLPTGSGDRTVVTVNYASPDGGCPTGETGTSPGVPYVSSVVSNDGAELEFIYKALSTGNQRQPVECVLGAVDIVDRQSGSGVNVPVVTYQYTLDGGAEAPGRIALVTWAESGRTESYNYGTTSAPTFGVSENGSPISTQTTSSAYHTDNLSALVVSDTSTSENLAISYYPTLSSCPTGLTCCIAYPGGSYVTDGAAGNGNGSAGANSALRNEYDFMGNGSSGDSPVLVQQVDSCTAGNCASMSPGSKLWDWTCAGPGKNGSQSYESDEKDKRDNYTVFVNAAADAGNVTAAADAGIELGGEVVEVDLGATAATGVGALVRKYYGYLYGGSGQGPTGFERLRDHEDVASVLTSGQDARTHAVYDPSTNRLKALIRYGWTQTFNGTSWSNVPRYAGTFYYVNHKCLSDGNDAQQRTLEVHGPCLVASYSSTDCDSGGIVPITQYFYYAASDPKNRSNRLQKVSKFTNNSGTSCTSASHLDTTYDVYTSRGYPTTITDPNGVVTTLVYQEDLVTSSTTAGLVTTYTYDNKKLTAVKYPQGNYDVFCYRTGTSSGCSGGTWTPLLQWKAKSSTATASTWSEKVVYTHWPDGTVNTETYETSSGEVRRVRKYAADAHRRPTWQQAGDATGSFTSVKFFDRADNNAGVGLAYNAAPAFCGGPQGSSGAALDSPVSTLCAALGYDTANRLIGLDEYPTSSSGATRTCMTYDAQGNVASVVSGCSASGGPGNCSSCTAKVSTYQYDDFGNVVSATLPWTGSGSSGITRDAFDAMGNVLTKQTPSMAAVNDYLQYAYDSLGRPLSLTHYYTQPSSGNEVLYAFAYDNGATLSGTCPQPANTLGRMLYRTDSFGNTWYQYDSLGRTTGELRLRTGTTTCSSSTPHLNPHTTYAYSGNGDVTSIVYPYGRTVTYTYGSGALVDRVSSVSVTKWTGTAWSTQSNVLSGAVWEPYGGLRGYQINHPTSGNASGVEYFLGDNSSVAPSASGCPTSVPSTVSSDHTGRVRALWISTGAFSAGSGNGATYKRTYTWQADQLYEDDTCLLGATTARTVNYAYDQLLRVTTGSRPSGNFAATGGAIGIRSYTYDGRGNRTGETHEDCAYADTYSSSTHPDQLTRQASSCTGSVLGHSYAYDVDGRLATKTWPVDSSGDAGTVFSLSSGDLGAASNGALDSVFKAVSVNGAVYNYYYDAFNRRRLKVYPAGPMDETFQDFSTELLVDQGNDSVTSPSWYPTDEYVWLGGRQVILVRSKFNTSWVRQADLSGDCTRNADPAPCNFYFPVTDTIGKPILMLDASRNVTGAADYDIFGLPNRVSLDKETAHPYANNTNITLADFIQPLGGSANPSVQVRVRAVFDLVDTEGPTGSPADYFYLKDPDGGSALTGHLGGPHVGQLWTAWVIPSAGRVQVPFLSNATGNTFAGVAMAGYEYQRFQTGAQPFWTPLGFRGQYHDAETDLFQNWNRFYDASIGRYLESEPELLAPSYLEETIGAGRSTPAYSFAFNNPLHYFDSTGLDADSDNIEDLDRKYKARAKNLECLSYRVTRADPPELLPPTDGFGFGFFKYIYHLITFFIPFVDAANNADAYNGSGGGGGGGGRGGGASAGANSCSCQVRK
jgi:RHS repeat-associated protein